MQHDWERYFDTESEYWEKVQKIYKENDNYPKIVVKNRNLHHKFLRSFSRHERTKIDNDKDNLVSLSQPDHLRVHYYLYKCTKKGFRNITGLPVRFMLKKAIGSISDETFEMIANDYDVFHLKSSEETKRKISVIVSNEMKDPKRKKKHMKGLNVWHKEIKGTKWWNNGITNKMSKECPGDGWVPGRLHYKRRPGSSHKGKHWKLVDGKRIYY